MKSPVNASNLYRHHHRHRCSMTPLARSAMLSATYHHIHAISQSKQQNPALFSPQIMPLQINLNGNRNRICRHYSRAGVQDALQ